MGRDGQKQVWDRPGLPQSPMFISGLRKKTNSNHFTNRYISVLDDLHCSNKLVLSFAGSPRVRIGDTLTLFTVKISIYETSQPHSPTRKQKDAGITQY